jgi:hypothetical protein
MDARLAVAASGCISPKARMGTASAIEGRGLVAIAPIAASELVAIKGGRNAPLAVIRLFWAAALIRSGSRSDWPLSRPCALELNSENS